jgi:signal transduction histidine kinase
MAVATDASASKKRALERTSGRPKMSPQMFTIWLVLANVVLLIVATVAGWPAASHSPLPFAANALGASAFLMVGMICHREFDRTSLVWCMVACGCLWAVKWLTSWNVGPFPVMGIYADTGFYTAAGLGVILYMARDGLTRFEKFLFACMLALPIDRTILLTSSRPEWAGFDAESWWPSVAPDFDRFEALKSAVFNFECGVAVALTVAVLLRVRSARGINVSLLRSIGFGFCMTGVAASIGQSTDQMFPGLSISSYYTWVAFITSLIPLGILMAIFVRYRHHFAMSRSLHRAFATTLPTVESVQSALRETLKDPLLEVLYWTPERNCYVDATGAKVSVDGITRLTRYVSDRNGNPLAILVADPGLVQHESILETAANASGVALENARLQAVVRSQLDEVRASRTRIVQASIDERRRLERDLHDGVQQRLLAVSTRLGALRSESTDAPMQKSMSDIGQELRTTIESLRDLAHGIHPPELTQFGLKAAVEVVAGGVSIPVITNVADMRFSEPVEITAYFVICESLTNVVKHSHATKAGVVVTHEADVLRITVWDNGRGCINAEKGFGLTSLEDRVAALGGTIEIHGLDTGGTKVEATIPCE